MTHQSERMAWHDILEKSSCATMCEIAVMVLTDCRSWHSSKCYVSLPGVNLVDNNIRTPLNSLLRCLELAFYRFQTRSCVSGTPFHVSPKRRGLAAFLLPPVANLIEHTLIIGDTSTLNLVNAASQNTQTQEC